MTKQILILLSLVFFSSSVISLELKPFSSDGCSFFPDGRYSQRALWRHCCFLHDLAYWKGGSEVQKKTADKALEQCVIKVGEVNIARLMLAGVEVGGSAHFNTSYRWGYGWPYGRGYKKLDKNEKLEVKQKLNDYKAMIDEIINQLSIEKNEG